MAYFSTVAVVVNASLQLAMTVGVYSYQNVFCMSDDMNVRQHLQQFIVCFVVQTAVQLILSDLL